MSNKYYSVEFKYELIKMGKLYQTYIQNITFVKIIYITGLKSLKEMDCKD